MQFRSFEEQEYSDYISRSEDEHNFIPWLESRDVLPSIIVTEGFEERSLGILEKIAKLQKRVPSLIIGRYVNDKGINKRYRNRFEKLAEIVSPGKWLIVKNRNDGKWIQKALELTQSNDIIFDISGISNIGLFGALDSIASSNRQVYIGYSEAGEYWPKLEDWEKLKDQLTGNTNIADIVDEQPWLFSYPHSVQIIPNHEGYDSAGSGRALIGFLPFKYARIAAILSEEDYSEMLFIAGQPRLKKNYWRLEALKMINTSILKDWQVVKMSTFGYRKSLEEFYPLLFSDNSTLQKCNLHLAILGSKLQTVSSWILSSLLKSITVVISIPYRYYPKAYSERIGSSWIFKFTLPNRLI